MIMSVDFPVISSRVAFKYNANCQDAVSNFNQKNSSAHYTFSSSLVEINELLQRSTYTNEYEAKSEKKEYKNLKYFQTIGDLSLVRSIENPLNIGEDYVKESQEFFKKARVAKIFVNASKVTMQQLVSSVLYEIFTYSFFYPPYIDNGWRLTNNPNLATYSWQRGTERIRTSEVQTELEKIKPSDLLRFACKCFLVFYSNDIGLYRRFYKILIYFGKRLKIKDNSFPSKITADTGITEVGKKTLDELEIELLQRIEFPATKDNWEIGMKSEHIDDDNYYNTLFNMTQWARKMLRTSGFLKSMDEIRPYTTNHDGAGDLLGDRNDSIIMTDENWVDKSERITLYDCKSSKEMLEFIVKELLKEPAPEPSTPKTLYRFGGIIIDTIKFREACERNYKKLVCENYRPVSWNGRRYEKDPDWRENQKKWARENMAVLLLLDASYGIRNYATQDFGSLINRWEKIVQLYTRKDNYDTEMNLLKTEKPPDKTMNDKAVDKFCMLLFTFILDKNNANPSKSQELRLGPSVTNIQTMISSEYQKIQKDLRVYDPFQILSSSPRDVEVKTKDVFRVLHYGYPGDIRSIFKQLGERVNEIVGGAGDDGGDGGDGGDSKSASASSPTSSLGTKTAPVAASPPPPPPGTPPSPASPPPPGITSVAASPPPPPPASPPSPSEERTFENMRFKEMKTKGDGWCLFRSTCAALGIITEEKAIQDDVPKEVKKIKKEVVEKLKKKDKTYYTIYDKNRRAKIGQEDINNEIENLKNLDKDSGYKNWPTDVSLHAIADLKKISIVVYGGLNDVTRILEGQGKTIYLYFTGKETGSTHYTYLKPFPKTLENNSLSPVLQVQEGATATAENPRVGVTGDGKRGKRGKRGYNVRLTAGFKNVVVIAILRIPQFNPELWAKISQYLFQKRDELAKLADSTEIYLSEPWDWGQQMIQDLFKNVEKDEESMGIAEEILYKPMMEKEVKLLQDTDVYSGGGLGPMLTPIGKKFRNLLESQNSTKLPSWLIPSLDMDIEKEININDIPEEAKFQALIINNNTHLLVSAGEYHMFATLYGVQSDENALMDTLTDVSVKNNDQNLQIVTGKGVVDDMSLHKYALSEEFKGTALGGNLNDLVQKMTTTPAPSNSLSNEGGVTSDGLIMIIVNLLLFLALRRFGRTALSYGRRRFSGRSQFTDEEIHTMLHEIMEMHLRMNKVEINF